MKTNKADRDKLVQFLKNINARGCDVEDICDDLEELEATVLPKGWNYIANHDTYPTQFTFDNGRIVRAVKTDDGQAVLEIDSQPLAQDDILGM